MASSPGHVMSSESTVSLDIVRQAPWEDSPFQPLKKFNIFCLFLLKLSQFYLYSDNIYTRYCPVMYFGLIFDIPIHNPYNIPGLNYYNTRWLWLMKAKMFCDVSFYCSVFCIPHFLHFWTGCVNTTPKYQQQMCFHFVFNMAGHMGTELSHQMGRVFSSGTGCHINIWTETCLPGGISHRQ